MRVSKLQNQNEKISQIKISLEGVHKKRDDMHHPFKVSFLESVAVTVSSCGSVSTIVSGRVVSGVGLVSRFQVQFRHFFCVFRNDNIFCGIAVRLCLHSRRVIVSISVRVSVFSASLLESRQCMKGRLCSCLRRYNFASGRGRNSSLVSVSVSSP